MASSSIPVEQRPIITSETIPTPSHGPGGSFSVISATKIDAPLVAVVTRVLDTRSWKRWNNFVLGVSDIKHPTDLSQKGPPPACLEGSDILGLETTIQKGTTLTFNVNLDPKDESKRANSSEKVSVLEDFEENGRKGVRVSWDFNMWMTTLVLRAARVQEFVELEGGQGTLYRSWETFYGLLAPVVKATQSKSLIWGFGAWMDGLKADAEKQGQGGAATTTTAEPERSEA